MLRLRHAASGVVVNVDDVTAARLVGEWAPVADGKADDKPAPARRRTSQKKKTSE